MNMFILRLERGDYYMMGGITPVREDATQLTETEARTELVRLRKHMQDEVMAILVEDED